MPRCTWWSATRPAKPGMVNAQIHAFGLATRAAPTCRVGLLTELWAACTIAQHEGNRAAAVSRVRAVALLPSASTRQPPPSAD